MLLDIYEVRVTGVSYQTPWVNRYYCREEVSCPSPNPSEVVVGAFLGRNLPGYLQWMSTNAAIRTVSARRVVPSPAATGLQLVQQPGNVGFPVATPLDAVVVSWFSLSAPILQTGRTYLSGFPKTLIGEGRIKGELRDLVNAWATEMLKPWNANFPEIGMWNFCLYSGVTEQYRPVESYRTNGNLGRMGTRRASAAIAQLVS